MILNGIRMLADRLADLTTGVNAELGNVQYDGTDVQPAAVAVYEETTTGWLARRQVPVPDQVVLPAVAVGLLQEFEVEGQVMTINRDATAVPFIVFYVGQDSKSEDGLRDACYVMRAVLRSLRGYFDDANLAGRTRNGVNIEGCASMRLTAARGLLGEAEATVAVLVSCQMRDTDP